MNIEFVVNYISNKLKENKNYIRYTFYELRVKNNVSNKIANEGEQNMNQYIYFILGILLGLAIAVYFFLSREEKIEKIIKYNQETFSSKRLDITMETVVDRIKMKIDEVKRDLTEDEKDEIIIQCCKEKFNI